MQAIVTEAPADVLTGAGVEAARAAPALRARHFAAGMLVACARVRIVKGLPAGGVAAGALFPRTQCPHHLALLLRQQHGTRRHNQCGHGAGHVGGTAAAIPRLRSVPGGDRAGRLSGAAGRVAANTGPARAPLGAARAAGHDVVRVAVRSGLCFGAVSGARRRPGTGRLAGWLAGWCWAPGSGSADGRRHRAAGPRRRGAQPVARARLSRACVRVCVCAARSCAVHSVVPCAACGCCGRRGGEPVGRPDRPGLRAPYAVRRAPCGRRGRDARATAHRGPRGRRRRLCRAVPSRSRHRHSGSSSRGRGSRGCTVAVVVRAGCGRAASNYGRDGGGGQQPARATRRIGRAVACGKNGAMRARTPMRARRHGALVARGGRDGSADTPRRRYASATQPTM